MPTGIVHDLNIIMARNWTDVRCYSGLALEKRRLPPLSSGNLLPAWPNRCTIFQRQGLGGDMAILPMRSAASANPTVERTVTAKSTVPARSAARFFDFMKEKE
jgi:hypothetical protein